MSYRNLLPCISLAAALCLAGCARKEVLSGDGLVILEGATLFAGSNGALRPNAVLVLQRDRIVRIGDIGEFDYPRDATVVDVRGRYIFPGLIDTHVHVDPKARVEIMRTLLAYGITTVRSPGAEDVAGGVELRGLIANGTLRGPRMFTAGPIITGEPDHIPGLPRGIPGMVIVRSSDEMRAEIRRQKELGVDLIKLFWDVTPSLLAVAVEEAHALGLQVAGHLGATTWTEAARLGIDFLEHSGFSGSKWDLLRDLRLKGQIRGQHPSRAAPGTLQPSEFYRLWSEAVDLHGPGMDSLATALRQNDVTVDPTLATVQSLYFGDDLEVLKRLEPDRMDPVILATWGSGWQQANPVVARDPMGVLQDFTSGKVIWPIAMQIIRGLHERGVRITAGSDVGMPWITPGISLHREMELLVEAGIPVRDVLLIATRNGAQALRLSAEIGTIDIGKVADLIVLRANPLEDIRNTRSIEAVYSFGRRYDPDALLAGRQ